MKTHRAKYVRRNSILQAFGPTQLHLHGAALPNEKDSRLLKNDMHTNKLVAIERRKSVIKFMNSSARRTSHMWLDDVVDQNALLKQGGDGDTIHYIVFPLIFTLFFTLLFTMLLILLFILLFALLALWNSYCC